MNSSEPPITDLRPSLAGGVLTLTLDGPETRNAISPPVYREIQARVIDAEHDPAVRAIVLTGAGGFFCSGGNVRGIQKSRQGTIAQASQNTDALNAMILAMRACPKPLVAAVEGAAAGAGLALALACDMIIAAAGAKFVAAYVKIGLSPDAGLTHFLREGLPRQLASEMCFLGRPVPAERLHAAGVVNAVCAKGEATTVAQALAADLAGGPVGAIGRIKAQIDEAPKNDLAAQLAIEAKAINEARFGDEAAEGLAAFVEKRAPDFARKT
ncbi:MAG: enoyl-CoA hydratase family protein [Pseudomonadota bacterium]